MNVHVSANIYAKVPKADDRESFDFLWIHYESPRIAVSSLRFVIYILRKYVATLILAGQISTFLFVCLDGNLTVGSGGTSGGWLRASICSWCGVTTARRFGRRPQGLRTIT